MSFRDRFCQLFVSERLYFCTPKEEKSAVKDRSHIIGCKKSAKKDVAKVFDLGQLAKISEGLTLEGRCPQRPYCVSCKSHWGQ